MFIDQLRNTFGFNKPIKTDEILDLFNNFTRTYVFRLIKKAKENGELCLFSRGIYYLPTNGLLGKTAICADIVAEKKYIKNNELVYGVYAGLNILNQFGITSQVPNTIEIVTNNEVTRKRKVIIDGKEFIIRKSRCEITIENYPEYTILQLFNDMNINDNLSEFSKSLIKNYIKKYQVNEKRLFFVAMFFPSSASQKLLRSGILNENI